MGNKISQSSQHLFICCKQNFIFKNVFFQQCECTRSQDRGCNWYQPPPVIYSWRDRLLKKLTVIVYPGGYPRCTAHDIQYT